MADLTSWKRENLERLAADLMAENERLKAENTALREDVQQAMFMWRSELQRAADRSAGGAW